MSEMMWVHDPTVEARALSRTAGAEALGSTLQGKTVLILDNGWSSYEIAGPVLKQELTERFGAAKVLERRKSMVASAPPEVYELGLQEADLVITWLGNCGACTSWSVHDAAEFTKQGRPALAFVTERFVTLADVVARGKGVAQLPIVVLPPDFEQSPHDEMRAAVLDSLDRFAALLDLEANQLDATASR